MKFDGEDEETLLCTLRSIINELTQIIEDIRVILNKYEQKKIDKKKVLTWEPFYKT